MLRPKSNQTCSGRQVSFSLLTSCQEPPEEIPERFADTHLGWKGRDSWVAEQCWAPDSSAEGGDDSWNAGFEKGNWPGCDGEMPALQRRISTWAAVNFSRAALPSSLFGSKSHLFRGGTQHVIILGSFPFWSMTLGESLTSDYALLREYKTVFRAKFCAFLTPEPCSHFFSVPMSLFWAEFLVTWAKIPRKRPLCADGRANSFNHNHKPLP